MAPQLAAAAVAHFFGGDGARLRPARQQGEGGEEGEEGEEEGEESAGRCWTEGPVDCSAPGAAPGGAGGQAAALGRRPRPTTCPGAAAGAGALDALLEQARLKARVMGHLPLETQRWGGGRGLAQLCAGRWLLVAGGCTPPPAPPPTHTLPARRRRMVAWLQRRGHSWDVVSAVLRALKLMG